MIDTCRRSVADQLIVPPVCDRIHRSLTVHSRVWPVCFVALVNTYGCCVFLSQVTLLHGVGASTPSGIPGKSPKLCSSTVTHAGDAGTALFSFTPSHSMCVFVFFFLSCRETKVVTQL